MPAPGAGAKTLGRRTGRAADRQFHAFKTMFAVSNPNWGRIGPRSASGCGFNPNNLSIWFGDGAGGPREDYGYWNLPKRRRNPAEKEYAIDVVIGKGRAGRSSSFRSHDEIRLITAAYFVIHEKNISKSRRSDRSASHYIQRFVAINLINTAGRP